MDEKQSKYVIIITTEIQIKFSPGTKILKFLSNASSIIRAKSIGLGLQNWGWGWAIGVAKLGLLRL